MDHCCQTNTDTLAVLRDRQNGLLLMRDRADDHNIRSAWDVIPAPLTELRLGFTMTVSD